MTCLAYLARRWTDFHRIFLIDSSLSASTVGSLHKKSFITGLLRVLSWAQYSFTLYTQPMSDIIFQRKCNHHKFAGGTQLHKSSAPSDFHSPIYDIEQCVDSVESWMTGNRLKLSNDKTEALVVGSRRRVSV